MPADAKHTDEMENEEQDHRATNNSADKNSNFERVAPLRLSGNFGKLCGNREQIYFESERPCSSKKSQDDGSINTPNAITTAPGPMPVAFANHPDTEVEQYWGKCCNCKNCKLEFFQNQIGEDWENRCNDIIEVCSCVCCTRAIFYHCGKTARDDGYDCSTYPCACCEKPDCLRRWTCMTVMSAFLPCMCCYWPSKGVVKMCSLCCV